MAPAFENDVLRNRDGEHRVVADSRSATEAGAAASTPAAREGQPCDLIPETGENGDSWKWGRRG